jgi:DNA primase
MIPQDTINKIIDATRIEEVIGDFVSLTRKGASYMACCPFHNEKTPSFVVTPSKGIYKCFGCGESGGAIKFLERHENMSYREALLYLAKKYHIEVQEKEESPELIQARQKSESLTLANEFAHQFYVANLSETEGKTVAMQYFKSRGLQEDTIAKWGLGWCPSDGQALLKKAKAAGLNTDYLKECGVLGEADGGRLYDRFRDRVVFPIHSVTGRVVAFSCRTLHAENMAKYVNSPTTEIYKKEKSLFGIYFAKSPIAKARKCYLVEGNLDVISLHQKGIQNTVASCGTALTSEQVQLIKRFTGEEGTVCVMYDGDGAGIKAAIKAINLILAEGLNVKLVLFPDGQDPDDFCRHHTLEEIQTFVEENEHDFISYRKLLAEKDLHDPLKRATLINELADTMACILDPVKRNVYIQECAKQFNIEEGTIRTRVEQTRRKLFESKVAGQVTPPSVEGSGDAGTSMASETSVASESLAGVYPAPSAPKTRRKNGADRLYLSEQSLLSYVLRYGCESLKFPKGSEFYVEDEPYTVFEFIDSSLADDGCEFSDALHQKIYLLYGQLFDQCLDSKQIERRLQEGEDREVADRVMQLRFDSQQLTMDSLLKSMMQKDSSLVKFVPRSLIEYNVARMEKQRRELRRKLTDADEQTQTQYMQQITELARKVKTLQQKLKEI